MDSFEQLEAYLEGELTEVDREAFEQEMEQNLELAQKVRLHQQLEVSLGNRKEIQVEAQWKQILEEEMAAEEAEIPHEEASAPPKSFPFRRVLSIAAVIVLLVAVGGWLYYANRPLPPETLYAAHYEPYDGSGELRTGEGVPPTKWEAAFNAYNAQKYPEAKTAFENVLALSPGSSRAHFYLGICAIESGDPQQARSHFETVLGDQGNLYTDQASWYLGLICLQTLDQACVEEHLRSLAEREGKYGSRAKKVVKRVKWE